VLQLTNDDVSRCPNVGELVAELALALNKNPQTPWTLSWEGYVGLPESLSVHQKEVVESNQRYQAKD
jgi:hypothetical protein